jgi:hypothetical protein
MRVCVVKKARALDSNSWRQNGTQLKHANSWGFDRTARGVRKTPPVGKSFLTLFVLRLGVATFLFHRQMMPGRWAQPLLPEDAVLSPPYCGTRVDAQLARLQIDQPMPSRIPHRSKTQPAPLVRSVPLRHRGNELARLYRVHTTVRKYIVALRRRWPTRASGLVLRRATLRLVAVHDPQCALPSSPPILYAKVTSTLVSLKQARSAKSAR